MTARPKKKRRGHGNPKNLMQNRTDLTPERKRELCSLGGKRGGETRRERRTFKEWALAIRDLPTDDPAYEGMTEGQAAIMRAYKEARGGNIAAIRFLAELAGEMVEKIETNEIPKLVFDI